MTLARQLHNVTNFRGINNRLEPVEIQPQGKPQTGQSSFTVTGTNIDINNLGMPTRRKGFAAASYSGSTIHSLWSNGQICLFVEGVDLKRLQSDFSASFIRASVGGARMRYVSPVGDTVYFTNTSIIGQIKAGVDTAFSVPTATYKIPMPPGHLIEWFNGRLYVARQGQIWFSDAMYPGQTDYRRNFKQLGGYISLLRWVPGGLFVSDSCATYFMGGLDPKEFNLVKVHDQPAILGTDTVLDGCLLGGLDLAGRVLLWLTPQGICLGMPGGAVKNLTFDSYWPQLTTPGSSLVRKHPAGFMQVLIAQEDIHVTGSLDIDLPAIKISATGVGAYSSINHTLSWTLPDDPDVVGVRVRALVSPSVPDYTTPYDSLGLVSSCVLPLAHMPPLVGTINFAVTGVDDTGLESDITSGSLIF